LKNIWTSQQIFFSATLIPVNQNHIYEALYSRKEPIIHQIHFYYIKMEDNGSDANCQTRCFISSTLSANKINRFVINQFIWFDLLSLCFPTLFLILCLRYTQTKYWSKLFYSTFCLIYMYNSQLSIDILKNMLKILFLIDFCFELFIIRTLREWSNFNLVITNICFSVF